MRRAVRRRPAGRGGGGGGGGGGAAVLRPRGAARGARASPGRRSRPARAGRGTDPRVRGSPIPRAVPGGGLRARGSGDRKSTRLNSSHLVISYAVFCLKKKKKTRR